MIHIIPGPKMINEGYSHIRAIDVPTEMGEVYTKYLCNGEIVRSGPHSLASLDYWRERLAENLRSGWWHLYCLFLIAQDIDTSERGA